MSLIDVPRTLLDFAGATPAQVPLQIVGGGRVATSVCSREANFASDVRSSNRPLEGFLVQACADRLCFPIINRSPRHSAQTAKSWRPWEATPCSRLCVDPGRSSDLRCSAAFTCRHGRRGPRVVLKTAIPDPSVCTRTMHE